MVNFNGTRENFFIGFVGDTKTGKTTLMYELARAWKAAKPKDYTVFGFDVHGDKGDVIDVKIDIADENWDSAIPNLRNSLIILDEVGLLHPEEKTRATFKNLCSSFQNRNNDVMYSVHNPKLILQTFTYYTTQYYIFKTNSKEGGFKDKIPDYRLAYAASLMVNKYTTANGKGTYPNFPFVEVNRLNGEVNAYNFNNVKDLRKQFK